MEILFIKETVFRKSRMRSSWVLENTLQIICLSWIMRKESAGMTLQSCRMDRSL